MNPDQKNWVKRVDLTEFTINVSVSQTTQFTPFKLNGGYLPSMIREFRNGEQPPPGVKAFATQALINLAQAYDVIIENRVFQTHHANKQRSSKPVIRKNNLVYLATKNLNLPKGCTQKLCPKFIGPYKVDEAHPESSTYTLQLPKALQEQWIHPTFHVNLLCPYHANNDELFPNRTQLDPYDFGALDDAEWFVNEIIRHRGSGKSLELQVCWSLGDTTWEPLASCNELAVLDRYLEIIGVQLPQQLPRHARGMPIVDEPVDLMRSRKLQMHLTQKGR